MVRSEIPKTLNACLELLSKDSFKILAGGTDLLVQNRSHASLPIGFKQNILYVANIEELNYVKADEENVYIGAVTTLEQILPDIQKIIMINRFRTAKKDI